MRILITGGSRGIGRACVERFAKDGHRVSFLYNKSAEAAEALAAATGATPIQADLGDKSQATAAVAEAISAMGGIDVLVNNAGIAAIKLFTDVSDEEWQSILNVNLSGAFYVTREAVRPMIAQQFGRVINLGSMWGKVGASCEVAYSSTKAGLRGMTMALAKELGPSGITVNCVEPGVIATEMNASLDEETLNALREETPLCRLGTPHEVAALIAFLASPEAGFITGQCIGIDGGFAIG